MSELSTERPHHTYYRLKGILERELLLYGFKTFLPFVAEQRYRNKKKFSLGCCNNLSTQLFMLWVCLKRVYINVFGHAKENCFI